MTSDAVANTIMYQISPHCFYSNDSILMTVHERNQPIDITIKLFILTVNNWRKKYKFTAARTQTIQSKRKLQSINSRFFIKLFRLQIKMYKTYPTDYLYVVLEELKTQTNSLEEKLYARALDQTEKRAFLDAVNNIVNIRSELLRRKNAF